MKLRYRSLSDVMVAYDPPLLGDELNGGAFDRADPVWDEGVSLVRQHPSHGKLSGRLMRSVVLCSFGGTVKESEVISAANDIGCVVATMAEVMAFVRTYPREQVHGPIVALGSLVQDKNGEVLCPLLANDPLDGRVLTVIRQQTLFSPQYRFLLVRSTIPLVRFAAL